jgi:hypothetical protein
MDAKLAETDLPHAESRKEGGLGSSFAQRNNLFSFQKSMPFERLIVSSSVEAFGRSWLVWWVSVLAKC